MRVVILFLMLLIGGSVYGKGIGDLQFKSDGSFKILQFTDVHFRYGHDTSDSTLRMLASLISTEKPDIIIFTGDIVVSSPAEQGLRAVLQVAEDAKIPFAYTFGNHDDEQDLSKEELIKIFQSYKYSVYNTADRYEGLTYVLPIKSGKDLGYLLYVIDSNTYSTFKGVKGYGSINADQIDWYKERSRYYTQMVGDTLPALAFFHIPLPEYKIAVQNEKIGLIGTRKESVCSPELNTGMFAAIKLMGDIRGCFVGHDHDNDYALSYYDVLLAYGRYSGGNTVYNNLKPAGCRVITIHKGSRDFDTYIRLRTGEVINKISYPQSFLR